MAPEPEDEIKDEKNPRPLDEDDIALLKTYVPSIFFLRLFFLSVFDLVVKLAFLSSFGS